jgi:hypothetical protein
MAWAARTPAAFTFNVKACSLFPHHPPRSPHCPCSAYEPPLPTNSSQHGDQRQQRISRTGEARPSKAVRDTS